MPSVKETPNLCSQQHKRKYSEDGNEESLGVYKFGGFHPVRIGEIYADKYLVLRKLGCGISSTVWLVRKKTDGSFWAMKVLSEACYEQGKQGVFEVDILRHLGRSGTVHPGQQHISILHDSFKHRGPNGSHTCLIFKVLGETLETFVTEFDGYRLPSWLVQQFVRQMLSALDFAHQSGIIHTDIKPANILIQLDDDSIIANEHLPSTKPEFYHMGNGGGAFQCMEAYKVTKSQPFSKPGIRSEKELKCLKVTLCDWGVASWTHKHLALVIQPERLRSPEVILGAPWDTSTDIWNFGAVIMELLNGRCMFKALRVGKDDYSTRAHLTEMEMLFGPFPRSLLLKANTGFMEKLFDREGRLRGKERRPFPVENMIIAMSREDKDVFVPFLWSMMELEPDRRKSAAELQKHIWLRQDSKPTFILKVKGGHQSKEKINEMSPTRKNLVLNEGTNGHQDGSLKTNRISALYRRVARWLFR